MKLLVDTCTFLWLASDFENIGRTATAALAEPENEKYLSAASAWEIAIKYSRGRLRLSGQPWPFISEIREKSGIETLAIDEETAVYTARLPKLHGDPFDRILVAQALIHGMVILTPDEAIAQYGARVLW